MKTIRELLADKSGNFAILTGVLLPVLCATFGFAIDAQNMIDHRLSLQASLDGAVLSGTSAMGTKHSDTTTAIAYAKKVLQIEMSNYLTSSELENLGTNTVFTVSTTQGTNAKIHTMSATARVTFRLTGFAKFLGYETATVAAVSSSRTEAETKNPISMYMVLDRSGSMSFVTDTVYSTTSKCQNYTSSNWGYYPDLSKTKPCMVNKMSALKSASDSLLDELDVVEALDATNSVIRLGAVSFNDDMQTPEALAWGTNKVRNYINALPDYPTGGTDMTDGLAKAYTDLTASSEVTAQANRNNTSFSKFIILMTDGENTGASSTWNPTLDATALATCSSARLAGITIYSVAFMAPTRGQTMLKACAGNIANYYEAEDMDSLVAAFKEIGSRASEQITRLTQ